MGDLHERVEIFRRGRNGHNEWSHGTTEAKLGWTSRPRGPHARPGVTPLSQTRSLIILDELDCGKGKGFRSAAQGNLPAHL